MAINVWNNINIKINESPVFYRRKYERNINFIQDLLNPEGKVLSYAQFQNKYGVQCHFLEFLGIKTAVESYIRQSGIDLRATSEPITNGVLPFNAKIILQNRKGSQDMYTIFTNKAVTTKSQIKWDQIFQKQRFELETYIQCTKDMLSKHKIALVTI